MRKISTTLLAAGLVALGACGGGAEQNVAVNESVDELQNLTPEALESETAGDEADANAAADNAVTENAVENSQ
ncbi:MAG: hypothetical protein KF780_01550 [Sphingomonas sp.]|nr:hypothetical protein [Sphingomonas sp.]